METLPVYITITFWITTLSTLVIFHWAVSNMKEDRYKANLILMGLTGWLIVQSILAQEGLYYENTDALPPQIVLFAILPMILLILVLFLSKSGKNFIDQLPLKQLTYLHIIRIPVEIVLFWLATEGVVSDVMTFEGRNFDILSGVTAPLVALFGLKNRKFMIAWNMVCLALLVNVVTHAVLSLPSPFQQLSFEQPNIAVMYFPYIWLPAFIVPVVLFSHLVSLRLLFKK